MQIHAQPNMFHLFTKGLDAKTNNFVRCVFGRGVGVIVMEVDILLIFYAAFCTTKITLFFVEMFWDQQSYKATL